jgi:hypothetical protein
MDRLFVLYPKEFKCFSKFKRKLLHITKNMKQFELLYLDDCNDLIMQYIEGSKSDVKVKQLTDFTLSEITHAIIFTDENLFTDELIQLKEANIPLRVISLKITRVINIKKEEQYKNIKSNPEYEYIGRGSYWGNPYSMFEAGEDRDEVIRKYDYDFTFDKFPNKEKEQVHQLAGKKLGCFCKPSTCHGDVLADYLNSWDDGK